MGEKIGPITVGGGDSEPQYFDGIEVAAVPRKRIRFRFLRDSPTGGREVIFLEVSEEVWHAMVEGAQVVRPARKPGERIERGEGGGFLDAVLHRALLRRTGMC
jgi:hypothetical protein